MSMISAQIDKLRKYANKVDGTFPMLANALRDAADTIWELRDDLQRANAENARLRSELDSVGTAAYLYGRSDLKAENAKLRELAKDMYKALFSLNLDHCQACPREDACVFMHKSFDCDECAFERDMTELGIEVPE